MTKASDNPFPSLLVQEAASDGSDFGNPAADYRRLFLGEDGALHLKDSAGAVTDVVAAGGDVATDTIWDAAGDLAVGSGANTASKLSIGAVGGAVSRINGAVAWNSGTSFPASKATGDRYWRSDIGMEFFWDGAQWKCTCPHLVTSLPTEELWGVATNGRRQRFVVPYKGTYSLYLETFWLNTLVLTTNDGSKYWTITLYRHDVDDATSALGSAVNTTGDTAAKWTAHPIAINAVLDTGAFMIGMQFGKTSTPGVLYAAGALSFRIITT